MKFFLSVFIFSRFISILIMQYQKSKPKQRAMDVFEKLN